VVVVRYDFLTLLTISIIYEEVYIFIGIITIIIIIILLLRMTTYPMRGRDRIKCNGNVDVVSH